MAQTTKKVNYMINDDIRKEFEELIPPGERSRIVNEALKKELLSIKRKKLAGKLLAIRAKGPSMSAKDIVAAVRKDRERQKD